MEDRSLVKKTPLAVRVWNFANSGKGLLSFWGVCFVGAVSSVVYMKVAYTRKRKLVVRKKIIDRHLSSPQSKQLQNNEG